MLSYYASHHNLHSFPTRRSSDLTGICSVRSARVRRYSRLYCPRGSGMKGNPKPWVFAFALLPALLLTSAARAQQSPPRTRRSEEHTSELQSRRDLVCRLLLEKKK